MGARDCPRKPALRAASVPIVTGSIEEAANHLGAIPLHILSTAGQELFHTNMLYWLARFHHKGAAIPVFNALGLSHLDNGQQRARIVEREKWHIDLYYDSGMGSTRLVLENKLTAVPRRSQLVEYHEELVTKHGIPEDLTAFTLLSLIPPLEVPEPWEYVDYSHLVDPLSEGVGLLSGFDRGLLEAYRELVIWLTRLRDAVSDLRTTDRWFLSAPERESLRTTRNLAMAEKMRMTLLAQDIRGSLAQPDLNLEVGLSNTNGLVTFYQAPEDSGDIRGWQLQANQFRRFVIVGSTGLHGKTNQANRERYVSSSHAEYFNAFPEGILLDSRSKREWLGYNPDFVYRYRLIPQDARWSDVVDVCTHAISGSQ